MFIYITKSARDVYAVGNIIACVLCCHLPEKGHSELFFKRDIEHLFSGKKEFKVRRKLIKRSLF
jgi:hypothetical protein